MIKLKKLKLHNYCQYKNFEIDLSDGNEIKKWMMYFGQNGIGKSNILNAIRLLSSPWRIKSRPDNKLFFRRLTYSENYIKGYEAFDNATTPFIMEAVFLVNGEEKRVVYQNDWDNYPNGISCCELPDDVFSAALYVDADNPMNMYKFQIKSYCRDDFIDFAKAVYGLECELPKTNLVEEYDQVTNEYIYFYTDFIIKKKQKQDHFKAFSAGEKKIVTLIAALFNTLYKNRTNENNIVLIDNIDCQIYFKRHILLIEKIEEYFPENQIIATTHSSVIINNMDDKYLCDLENI